MLPMSNCCKLYNLFSLQHQPNMCVPPIEEDKHKTPVGDDYEADAEPPVHDKYKVDDSHEVICYFRHFNYLFHESVGFNKLYIKFF